MSSTHTHRTLTGKRPLERLLETARHDSAPPSTLSMQCKLLMPTRQPSETALAQTLPKSCTVLASGAYGWQPARQRAANQIPPATSGPETAWIFHKNQATQGSRTCASSRRRKALTATPPCALHSQRMAPLRALRAGIPILSSKKPGSPREPGSYTIWRRRRDSNPRTRGYRINGFRDRRIQPLCHPSAWGESARLKDAPQNKQLAESQGFEPWRRF